MPGYKRFRRSDLRLTIWSMLLACVCCLSVVKYVKLQESTYAFTLSFGRGVGFVIYTDAYQELPYYLQRSVQLHEGVHLREGTLKFWDSDGEEIIAYREQIADLKVKIAETYDLYRKTHDPRFYRMYRDYRNFLSEVTEAMQTYIKK